MMQADGSLRPAVESAVVCWSKQENLKAAAHYGWNAFRLAACILYESTHIKGGFT